MNANDLRNAILALNFIDHDEFWKATFPKELWGTRSAVVCWELFTGDPTRYYTGTTDEHREALFALIQEKLDKGE